MRGSALTAEAGSIGLVLKNEQSSLLLRGWREQAVEAEVHGGRAVMVGPVVGEGDQSESPRCFAPDVLENGRGAGDSYCLLHDDGRVDPSQLGSFRRYIATFGFAGLGIVIDVITRLHSPSAQ